MFMAKKRIKSYNAVEEKVKKEFFMNEKLKCHCMIHKPYPEIKPAKKILLLHRFCRFLMREAAGRYRRFFHIYTEAPCLTEVKIRRFPMY